MSNAPLRLTPAQRRLRDRLWRHYLWCYYRHELAYYRGLAHDTAWNEWEESKHPRKSNGEFTWKGMGEAGAARAPAGPARTGAGTATGGSGTGSPSARYVSYVGQHRTRIGAFARALGLPPEAIAAAVGEEYRATFRVPGVGRIKDVGLERNGQEMIEKSARPVPYINAAGIMKFDPPEYASRNQYVESEYNKYRKVIESGGVIQRAGFWGGISIKLGWADSPITNDIGYGNINFGKAIKLVKDYWNSPLAKGDPLGLNPYRGRLDRLYADLINPQSDTTFAVAALALKEVQDHYLDLQSHNPAIDRKMAHYYQTATPAEKAFLLDYGYRTSFGKVDTNISNLIRKYNLNTTDFVNIIKSGRGKEVERGLRPGYEDYFKSQEYNDIQSLFAQK
jgi:hypothetical protein